MGKSERHEKKSKKKHKHKKEKKKHKSKKSQKESKQLTRSKEQRKSALVQDVTTTLTKSEAGEEGTNGFEIPIELMNSKSHVPLTPEEYQRRQSQIRRIVDPSTGRTRLVRGDGEVLEEIVSKARHAEINKAATSNDGQFFQEKTVAVALTQKKRKS